MNKQPDPRKQANDLITALGSFAEMTHVFYKAMIDTGADKEEATAAMNAYIFAFWREQMEDARQKRKEEQQQQDE